MRWTNKQMQTMSTQEDCANWLMNKNSRNFYILFCFLVLCFCQSVSLSVSLFFSLSIYFSLFAFTLVSLSFFSWVNPGQTLSFLHVFMLRLKFVNFFTLFCKVYLSLWWMPKSSSIVEKICQALLPKIFNTVDPHCGTFLLK